MAVGRVRFLTYALCGALGGICGALLAGYFRGGTTHPAGLIDLAWADRQGSLAAALPGLTMPIPDSQALPILAVVVRVAIMAALLLMLGFLPVTAAAPAIFVALREVVPDDTVRPPPKVVRPVPTFRVFVPVTVAVSTLQVTSLNSAISEAASSAWIAVAMVSPSDSGRQLELKSPSAKSDGGRSGMSRMVGFETVMA